MNNMMLEFFKPFVLLSLKIVKILAIVLLILINIHLLFFYFIIKKS